ncbi:redox-sensing transcriptional repressor Rex [Longirhabdus pacifica]|uniref:redox-sensing transcriptional repressor Rex n=1 Tax=Longirhabdus pacifica TaxID=2305227 RepID=UPI001008B49B|nr:redox-sensing transcriptional repressor Rex [Longirhabdus pacifica]
MKALHISEAVVRRMPIYLRYLNEMKQAQIATVSSQELGKRLNLNPAQIRKDLAYFGEFGKKGIGYDISYLIQKIRQILKLDQIIHVALIGAGNLGQALSNYNKYLKDNMQITAIFDNAPQKVNTKIHHLSVEPLNVLKQRVKELDIRVGIITVPQHEAQSVADLLVEAGIEAILNFAPAIIHVPDHVRIHHADFTAELYSLAYYLEDEE